MAHSCSTHAWAAITTTDRLLQPGAALAACEAASEVGSALPLTHDYLSSAGHWLLSQWSADASHACHADAIAELGSLDRRAASGIAALTLLNIASLSLRSEPLPVNLVATWDPAAAAAASRAGAACPDRLVRQRSFCGDQLVPRLVQI